MLVLLPPSETKRNMEHPQHPQDEERDHQAEQFAAISTALAAVESPLSAALADTRRAATHASVHAALGKLCAQPDEVAYKSLKLRPSNKADAAFAANLNLAHAPRAAAITMYTGVLYDALDVTTLPADGLAWLAQHVAVQSALYGLVGAAEPIANYRLSAGSKLPELGQPLQRVWRDSYAGFPWTVHGFVLDLRSQDYAALHPLPADSNGLRLEIATRDANGVTRALNHFNKAAKGDLVRRLAVSLAQPASAAEFAAWAHSQNLELLLASDDKTALTAIPAAKAKPPVATLITDIGAPKSKI